MIQTIEKTFIDISGDVDKEQVIIQYLKAGAAPEECEITEIASYEASDISYISVFDGELGGQQKHYKPNATEITLEQLIEFNNRNSKPEEFVTDAGLIVFKKARFMEVSDYSNFREKRVRWVFATNTWSGAFWTTQSEEDFSKPTWYAHAREIQPEKVKISKAQYDAIQSGNYEITD